MVLCVGAAPTVQRSMHFRSFTPGEVNRAAEVSQVASGKSINVARVLVTLGEEVQATGFLGGDTGRYMRSELRREGIAEVFIEVPCPTRTCTTILDQASGQTTELVEEAGPVAPQHWESLLALIQDHLKAATAMVLSGNLSPSAPRDFYARCAAAAEAAGVPTIIDARGEPLKLALPHHPIMVKPNREELSHTVGRPISDDNSLRDAISQLLALGPKSALITMGAAGALFADGKQLWRVHSPHVQTVNPIGSGDSVAAGFTAGLVRKLPLQDCVRLGIACGAANAMTLTPGCLDASVVDSLLPAVRFQSLA